MWTKFLILSLIISLSLAQSLGEVKPYSDPHRTGIPAKLQIELEAILHHNHTSGSLQVPESKHQSEVRPQDSWEPLACSQCLSDRYLIHYLEKGCKPVGNEYFCKKPCPKYFECPDKKLDAVVEGCEYNGKVYKFGERVDVSNACKQSCFCDRNSDQQNISKPEIQCALVDCFNNFRAPTPNCFTVYDEGKCCPREKCLTKEQMTMDKQCLYDGKQYHLEQKIYPKEDPCLECVCDEHWNQTNPVKSSGCKPIKCDIQSDNKFKAGCLPIYHEKTCCPIEYFCPPPEEHQCKFNGKNYLIGERMNINVEKTECTCLMPPDFTCIRKSEEKTTMDKSNEPADYIKKFQTLPKIDITDSSNNPFANIPDVNTNTKCAPFITGGLTCAGFNCTTIIDGDGCQACKCQEPCPTMECKTGCTLMATTPGVCPECNCS